MLNRQLLTPNALAPTPNTQYLALNAQFLMPNANT